MPKLVRTALEWLPRIRVEVGRGALLYIGSNQDVLAYRCVEHFVVSKKLRCASVTADRVARAKD
jgi:hypothetical protein